MAMPDFPKTIQQELHYYLYVPSPNSPLVMFEHKMQKADPDWLYAFSTKLDIPVPEDLAQTMLERINPHFAEAERGIQAEAGVKLNYLETMRSKFLALEN